MSEDKSLPAFMAEILARSKPAGGRRCGSCTLCCKLLPVDEGMVAKKEGTDVAVTLVGWHKMAGERCRHQSSSKGCKVHGTNSQPIACKSWTCRWLSDPEASGLPRPDRSGYVVDTQEDEGVLNTPDGAFKYASIQIWVDPARPLSYRDPALLRYLYDQWVRYRKLSCIRFDEARGRTLFPSEAEDGTFLGWVEKDWVAAPGMEEVRDRARKGDAEALDIIRSAVERNAERPINNRRR